MVDRDRWDIQSNDNRLVGAKIAEFALGSLAEMVDQNYSPKAVYIDGTVPYLGSEISVRWGLFETLLASIVAAHTIVILLNYWALKKTPGRQA